MIFCNSPGTSSLIMLRITLVHFIQKNILIHNLGSYDQSSVFNYNTIFLMASSITHTEIIMNIKSIYSHALRFIKTVEKKQNAVVSRYSILTLLQSAFKPLNVYSRLNFIWLILLQTNKAQEAGGRRAIDGRRISQIKFNRLYLLGKISFVAC